jgi:heme/copper-type cytochrome/quinol oxidase subunit 4
MGYLKKEISIGFLISIFATCCSFFIYLQYISESDINTTFQKIKDGGVLGTVISLAAIPNLFVFFIFLKKKQDYRARGVLIATIAITLITFALKFF